MLKNPAKNMPILFAFILMAMGIICIMFSAFFVSSYLAILSVTFLFWGGLLLYIKPTKHVPLGFLVASTISNMSNTERLFYELKITEKGIYLPPKYLQDANLSLIFIPKLENQCLPQPEEIIMSNLFSKKNDALFLTPPGYGLSRIYEQKLGISFTRVDLVHLRSSLQKVLVETLEIAENVEIHLQKSAILIEVLDCIFKDDSQEAWKFPNATNILGSLLSSSIACVLAKATGKPIIINKEIIDRNSKTFQIEYQLLEML